jgi:LAS superfamily LD-carboxypeptidase LdcB
LVQEQSVDPSNNGIGPILLDPGFAVQWFRLKEAAMADGINLQITAGYRSFEYQRRIYEDDGRNYLAASAGASNHGLGKAIDLANCSFGSKIFNWMKNNGKKYGFYNVLGAKDPVHWSSTGR